MRRVHDGLVARHALSLGHDDIIHQQDGVLGRDPHQHQHPDQGRHGEVGAADSQGDEGAADGQRQGGHDGDRIGEAFEQQRQNRIHEQNARGEGDGEAGQHLLNELGVAGRHLTHAGGQVLDRGQAVDRRARRTGGDAVQLGADRGDTRPILAGDGGRTGAELDIGDGAERNRGSARRRHAQVLQHGQILARICGQLQADRDLAVAEIVLGQVLIHVADGGDPHGLGDGARRNAGQGRLVGTWRDQNFGSGDGGRVDDVGQAGDAAHLFLDLSRRCVQGVGIIAEDREGVAGAVAGTAALLGDAGADAGAGDLFQLVHHGAGEGLLAQFAVALGDHVGIDIGLGHVLTADGGIDRDHLGTGFQLLCDLPNHGVGLGQRRARRQFDLEGGAGGIAGRHEFERHLGDDGRGDGAEQKQHAEDQDFPPVAQRPAQRLQIAAHPERIAILMVGVLEYVGRHQRRQGARHQQREGDGNAGGQREGLEELPDDAGHEADGREDGDDGGGGGHDRQTDLVGRLQRGVVRRFSVAHVAHDVLDLHDRIVDQDADRQRQGQQGHHVQRLVQRAQDGEGRDQRHRHGNGRDEGRPPVAQEDEDDDDRQHGAQQQSLQRGQIGFLDLFDAGGDLLDRQFGVGVVEFLDLLADPFGDLDLGRGARPQEVEGDGFLAVVAGQAARLAPFVLDRAQVIEADGLAVAQGDQGLAKLRHRGRGAEGAHGPLGACDGDAAAR